MSLNCKIHLDSEYCMSLSYSSPFLSFPSLLNRLINNHHIWSIQIPLLVYPFQLNAKFACVNLRQNPYQTKTPLFNSQNALINKSTQLLASITDQLPARGMVRKLGWIAFSLKVTATQGERRRVALLQ